MCHEAVCDERIPEDYVLAGRAEGVHHDHTHGPEYCWDPGCWDGGSRGWGTADLDAEHHCVAVAWGVPPQQCGCPECTAEVEGYGPR